MKYFSRLIIFLIIILIFLQGINIFLENKTSLDSIKASKLREEIANLQEKNGIISSQVIQYSSFDTISSRAAELGFVEARQTISLFTPIPLALKK